MKYLSLLCMPFILAFPQEEKQTSGLQSIEVTGILKCGSKPAKDVLIKLIDDDFGPDADDDLGRVTTDANGKFTIKGNTEEHTSIDASLHIYHDCNDGMTVFFPQSLSLSLVNVAGNSSFRLTYQLKDPQHWHMELRSNPTSGKTRLPPLMH